MITQNIPRASHSAAVLASRSHLLYRIDGKHRGQSYWAYALIDPGKLEAFKKTIETGYIHVQEYGKVLAWGMGTEPPEDVRNELKERYNFDLIC